MGSESNGAELSEPARTRGGVCHHSPPSATVITKRAIFLIGRKKGAFLASGDSEAICVRAKYER